MNVLENLKGIISVVNTPYTEQNTIDEPSIRRYVKFALENKVVGFLVPAMAAEVNKLSDEERDLIVRNVLDEVKGKVPVIGGASASSQKERLNYVKKLQELGCAGVLVHIPFEDEKAYKEHIYQIADSVNGFLMIQDWDFKGFGIPVKTIVELFKQIDVFKCLKVEVVPAGMKYSEVLKATDNRLHVSGGWASSQMIEALDRGVHAFMVTILHDILGKIYILHKQGEREKAENLFRDVLPALAFSHQHIDISIYFNKRFCFKKGLFSTSNVRQPILPFDKNHLRIADDLIENTFHLSELIKDS